MCIAIANFSFHFSRFNFWLLIFSVITCAWIFMIPFLAAHFLSSYMFLIFQFSWLLSYYFCKSIFQLLSSYMFLNSIVGCSCSQIFEIQFLVTHFLRTHNSIFSYSFSQSHSWNSCICSAMYISSVRSVHRSWVGFCILLSPQGLLSQLACSTPTLSYPGVGGAIGVWGQGWGVPLVCEGGAPHDGAWWGFAPMVVVAVTPLEDGLSCLVKLVICSQPAKVVPTKQFSLYNRPTTPSPDHLPFIIDSI
jgi:hypothetical protein